MHMNAENDEIACLSAQKRSYSTPVLVRYGAVSELTQAGSISSNESASNPCPQTDMTQNFNVNCMN
jgi:hypothetical protein